MYCGSPSSVTHEENCAESATTLAPQITASNNSAHTLPPNKKPTSKQQLPLIAIATDVTTVRPTRSAISPATTHPIAPAPITANDPISAKIGSPLWVVTLARIIVGIQTHIAYSSHMCPK